MKSNNLIARLGAAVLSGLLACAAPVRGATLDGDTNLNNDNVQIPLEGGTQNVKYDADADFGAFTGGYVFGDRHADGSAVAVTPAGLSLGARWLGFGSSGTSGSLRDLCFDLDGAMLTATTGYIANTNSGVTGSIVLRNVGGIAMGDGYLTTMRHTYTAGSRALGGISIGAAEQRAGDIQLAMLDASLHTPTHGESVGEILVFGDGDVIIANSLGQPGGIFHGKNPNNNRGEGNNMIISHKGRFKAGVINTHRVRTVNDTLAYQLAIDGAYDALPPTGTCEIGGISARAWLGSGVNGNRTFRHVGIVEIRNYKSVDIAGDIETATGSYSGGFRMMGRAGDIAITGVTGDVRIGGSIDASSIDTGNPIDKRGALEVVCGGRLHLAELDMGLLQSASLSAAGGVRIEGALGGFDAAGAGGGAAGDPVATTQTALRVPAGAVAEYDASVNPHLEGKHYLLADLAGVAGQGGVLKPGGTTGLLITVR